MRADERRNPGPGLAARITSAPDRQHLRLQALLELKQTGGAIHTHLLAPPVSPSNPTIFKSAVEGPHQRFPKGISFREERPAVFFLPTADCVNAGREAVRSISKAARRNISISGGALWRARSVTLNRNWTN